MAKGEHSGSGERLVISKNIENNNSCQRRELHIKGLTYKVNKLK